MPGSANSAATQRQRGTRRSEQCGIAAVARPPYRQDAGQRREQHDPPQRHGHLAADDGVVAAVAQREVGESLGSQFVFLHRGIEIRTVGGGRKNGPEQREPRAAVECRGDDRKIINRIVTAVDSDFAGVIDEDGS